MAMHRLGGGIGIAPLERGQDRLVLLDGHELAARDAHAGGMVFRQPVEDAATDCGEERITSKRGERRVELTVERHEFMGARQGTPLGVDYPRRSLKSQRRGALRREPGNPALEQQAGFLEMIERIDIRGDERPHALGELGYDNVWSDTDDDGSLALGDMNDAKPFERLERLANDRPRDVKNGREMSLGRQPRIDREFTGLDRPQQLLTDAFVKALPDDWGEGRGSTHGIVPAERSLA